MIGAILPLFVIVMLSKNINELAENDEMIRGKTAL